MTIACGLVGGAPIRNADGGDVLLDLIHLSTGDTPVRDPKTYDEFSMVQSRQVDAGWLRRQIRRWVGAGLARARHLGDAGTLWEFHLQMNCLTPVSIRYAGIAAYSKHAVKPVLVDAYYRCRKCEGCMDTRARMWAGRAHDEFGRAERTYMATFTLSPEEHALLDVRVAAAGRWPDRSRLSEAEWHTKLFAARAAAFGAELTKWLKLARKRSFERHGQAGALRYLLVAEAHDSEKTDESIRGRPHFHALLHEQFRGALFRGDPVTALVEGKSDELEMRRYKVGGEWKQGVFVADEATVRQEWQLGFTKFQLCFDAKSAFYLCKYMSKALMYRVRASKHYGRENDKECNERSEVEQKKDEKSFCSET